MSGEILLSGPKRNLERHTFTFEWDRTIRSQRANETLRGEIHQIERLEGLIQAVR